MALFCVVQKTQFVREEMVSHRNIVPKILLCAKKGSIM